MKHFSPHRKGDSQIFVLSCAAALLTQPFNHSTASFLSGRRIIMDVDPRHYDHIVSFISSQSLMTIFIELHCLLSYFCSVQSPLLDYFLSFSWSICEVLVGPQLFLMFFFLLISKIHFYFHFCLLRKASIIVNWMLVWGNDEVILVPNALVMC